GQHVGADLRGTGKLGQHGPRRGLREQIHGTHQVWSSPRRAADGRGEKSGDGRLEDVEPFTQGLAFLEKDLCRVRSVEPLQRFTRLLQAEPQRFPPLDEGRPVHVRLGVKTKSAPRTGRGLHRADLAVVTDGSQGRPGPRGDLTDLYVVRFRHPAPHSRRTHCNFGPVSGFPGGYTSVSRCPEASFRRGPSGCSRCRSSTPRAPSPRRRRGWRAGGSGSETK